MTRWTLVLFLAGAILGCGKPASPVRPQAPSEGSSKAAASTQSANPGAEDPEKPKRKGFKPVEIGSSGAGAVPVADNGERVESARAALKPLQILVGNWNGTSRTATIDQPNWAWDLKTDPKQPALRVQSEKGQHLHDGRLTFVPATQEFVFSTSSLDGKKREYRGNFTQEVQDVLGDDKKLQRTYKLELTEPQADSDGDQGRLVINQQENNRYILEIYRKRGTGQFQRIDSVNTQREGTSFALSDTDYGDKTCVISQGLGTISVSYKGKSYWVCCTGCKAAFEDDPEKWIAKWEAMNKDKMQKN